MPKCQVCGRDLKNPGTKSHINSKFHQKALKDQGGVSSAVTHTTISRRRSEAVGSGRSFENRINLLEDQVKFVMNKLNAIDVKLANFGSTANDLTTAPNIKTRIKRMVPPGESVTIDELLKSRELRGVNWKILEKSLLDLVDDEVFDVTEGKSNKKIAGNIGRLIRR